MSRLSLCIKKDKTEYLRSNKLTITVVFLGLFLGFLLIVTAVIPRLSEMAKNELGALADSMGGIIDFLTDYFPRTLTDSCAFYSAEVGLFYCILVIAFSFNVLPKEIKSGRLILPICNGYQQKEIFISKQLVYSLFASVPAGLAYFLYYLIGKTFLYDDYAVVQALIGSVAMFFNVFCIVAITIALSVIYKYSVLVIISMGLTVAASPDLLYYLPFGKFIPTYIFTYLNYSESNPVWLIAPVLEYIAILVILDLVVIKRKFAVIVDERR